jgi:hypothetical protein
MKNDIEVLKEATSYLDFFAKMEDHPVYKERQVHKQCCQKMIYKFSTKGDAVILISKGNG